MNIKKWKMLKKSALVALVIAILLPALWFIFLGHTNRSPVVEKGYVESMSGYDREMWFQDNMITVSFFEHVKSTPRFIVEHWWGYIQTSFGVFVVIFVLNAAFLLGGMRNEP